jgi:hypothetical protein
MVFAMGLLTFVVPIAFPAAREGRHGIAGLE